MDINKEYSYKEFIQHEDNILRAPYNPELEFYSIIKSGDVDKTRELCRESLLEKKGLGKLSDNPLRNFKYHLTISIALIARYCIEGGMDLSTAYGLSDFYIQKVDNAKSLKEIDEIHATLAEDYAKRMKKLRNKKICSKPVALCIDYIYDNLHTRITVDTLAKHVNLTTSYLSRLFKKETGLTISDYIQGIKIETAQNMLIYSDYSPSQIASILAFPNQSYFTEVFHKRVGVTPKKYQSLHIRETEIGKKYK